MPSTTTGAEHNVALALGQLAVQWWEVCARSHDEIGKEWSCKRSAQQTQRSCFGCDGNQIYSVPDKRISSLVNGKRGPAPRLSWSTRLYRQRGETSFDLGDLHTPIIWWRSAFWTPIFPWRKVGCLCSGHLLTQASLGGVGVTVHRKSL